MTEFEALEAMFGANQAMNNAFQYWLSVTFAIILTAHLARRHLNPPILLTIGLLYFGAALLFFVDYLHWLAIMQQIQDPFFGEYATGYGLTKTIVRTGLFLIGTVTAEGYLIYSYRQKKEI